MTEMRYKAVPEKTIFIDLPETKSLKIKGILRGSLTQPLVIIMHGRPGSGNDLLPYLGAHYLLQQGLSSLRLFMYDNGPDSRNLTDCTLETHTKDFETVVKYLREHKVPKIFAAGHSYGGITILASSTKLDGAVLWDASHGLSWQEKDPNNKIKEADGIIVGLNGRGYIVPKAMDEADKALDNTSSWAQKDYPLKIISAPASRLGKYGKRYFDKANEPKEYVEITGAGHSFNESDEIMLQLFKETAEWFNRFKHG